MKLCRRNDLCYQDGALLLSTFILPAGLFLCTEMEHSSTVDKERAGARGSWLAG